MKDKPLSTKQKQRKRVFIYDFLLKLKKEDPFNIFCDDCFENLQNVNNYEKARVETYAPLNFNTCKTCKIDLNEAAVFLSGSSTRSFSRSYSSKVQTIKLFFAELKGCLNDSCTNTKLCIYCMQFYLNYFQVDYNLQDNQSIEKSAEENLDGQLEIELSTLGKIEGKSINSCIYFYSCLILVFYMML